jgi:NAD(P)-dependent dehydrogenase (short-subunit alcohol dehydrogenase family)
MNMTKTVCVTGADRGIGFALAKRLLEEEYTVFAGGIRETNEAMDVLKEVHGDRLHPFHLDVGSDESVRSAAEFVRSKTDALDFIINNAAILGDTTKTIEDELNFDDMIACYNVTAVGAIRVANALIGPVMNGGKLIVNISSEAGSIGQSYREAWFAYCMAKAALNMGSTIIQNRIRKQGGRVLLLHPGWVKTFLRGEWDDRGTYTPEEAAAYILKTIRERGGELHDQPLYLEADTGRALPW